jgi:uncharacterized membrane protein
VEILFIGFLALVFLGLLVVGPVLALLNASKLRQVERTSAELAARVARLEAQPGVKPQAGATARSVGEAPEPETQQIRTVEETPPTEPQAAPASVAPPDRSSPAPPARLDLESLIAGRWLNRIGIVAVMLAVAFFLKYAFDNQWVGPTGRVAIGLLAGTALLVASQKFLGRGYRYFSEGIAALGGGVLFLSIYAAWDFYQLIPQGAAFGGMALVTAALVGLAMGRNSERLAVLALGAGLTTPGLLSTGVDRQSTLFTYIAVLVACFLVLAWRKGWRWVAPVALLGTLIYLIGWYEQFYSSRKLVRTCIFASLFFGEFAAYLLLRAQLGRALHNAELLLIPANAAWYGVGLHFLLYRDHRWWLTGTVLVLGALYLGAARLATGSEKNKVSAERLLYAGLALTFVTAAIPIRLEGEWITIAWAVEGTLLVWAGFRADVRALRAAGLALFVILAGLLWSQSGATARLFLNQRFASFAAVVAALAICAYWARSRWAELDRGERLAFQVAAVATNIVAVWGLSEEVWHVLGRQQWDLDSRLARQMGLSLLWALAASLMILAGVRMRAKALRWQGLVLLGITVVKVFLLDLSFLERAYRIASFLVLGIVLLVVSFWYQRSLSAARGEDLPDRLEGGDE